MIRASELEQVAEDGASNRRVVELLPEGPPDSDPTTEEFPHVHPDHSLSLALERMGTTGMNVLPVVSRANVRQMLGIVALDDILGAYGVGKQGGHEDRSE
jgi:CBS domain-containing protein